MPSDELVDALPDETLERALTRPEFFQDVLDAVSDGVYMVDRQRSVLYWNHGAERLTGYTKQEALGRRCGESLLQHCTADGILLCSGACPLSETMEDLRPRSASLYVLHKDGHRLPVRIHASPLLSAHRDCLGAVEMMRGTPVASSQTSRSSDLEHLRQYDADTGVPVAGLTQARLRQAMLRAQLEKLPLAVMVARIDDFAGLALRFGRNGATQALRVAAQTMVHCTRFEDFVGRWKDDAFLLFAFVKRPSDAGVLSDRLRRLISLSVLRWWGEVLPLRASLGYTLFDGEESLANVAGRAEELAGPQASES